MFPPSPQQDQGVGSFLLGRTEREGPSGLGRDAAGQRSAPRLTPGGSGLRGGRDPQLRAEVWRSQPSARRKRGAQLVPHQAWLPGSTCGSAPAQRLGGSGPALMHFALGRHLLSSRAQRAGLASALGSCPCPQPGPGPQCSGRPRVALSPPLLPTPPAKCAQPTQPWRASDPGLRRPRLGASGCGARAEPAGTGAQCGVSAASISRREADRGGVSSRAAGRAAPLPGDPARDPPRFFGPLTGLCSPSAFPPSRLLAFLSHSFHPA